MNTVTPSFENLYILLILLPGFITLIIEKSLAHQKESPGVITIAKALLYSFLNYTIFTLLNRPLIYGTIFKNDEGLTQYTINANWSDSLILLTSSIVLGVLIGLFKTKDWHMRFFRWVGITRRTARSSIWLDIFHDKYSRKRIIKEQDEDITGCYVYVILKDERIIYGWPEYFSDDFNDGPALFISKAMWLDEDEELSVEIPYPGILIMGSEIQYIQFHMKQED
ncbi:MAG: hypothetical protein HQ591_08840 [candidate division Zixibacteria bacterium]|nr:hypothetical protein [Candidatus Tariuqbacter arcticus]